MAFKYDKMYAAVVTPYKAGTLEIDEQALRKMLRYFMQPKFLNAGGAIIIQPEAGEVFYLTREEKRRNIEIAMEECGGKCPVFAGCIQPTTAGTILEAKDAKAAGADGIFVMPPMGAEDITTGWNAERTPEVWIEMAKAVCDAVDLPAIAHPITGTHPFYGRGFPMPSMIKMLDAVPQFVGWKMTYPWPAFLVIAKALRGYKRHVGIFPAGAMAFHEALAYEFFDGTVSGFWNYAMEPMVDHIEAWRRNDIETARKIWFSGLWEIHNYMTGGPGEMRLHTRYKIASWLRGLVPEPFMRPPMPKPRLEEVREIRRLLQVINLDVISESAVRKPFPDY